MQVRNLAHIGVGNFHRAHQAEFFQQLNEITTDYEKWNIVGISLMPQDESLFKKLKTQNFKYHLIKRASNGVEKINEIDVIDDLIFAVTERDKTMKFLTDLSTEIISFTITEGAYLFDQKSKKLDWQHPDLVHDMNNLEQPKTIFGLLFNVLNQRSQSHGQGLTLMSCDNIRHNGQVLKQALCEFISKIDTDLISWVNAEVCFPCTMVDRITPGSTVVDQQHLKDNYGIDDLVPVVCESFRQWVIEDKFRFPRPDIDKVGAIYVSDVSSFEDLKIKLLNGGHSSLAYLASLAGYEYVHEAIANKSLHEFVKSYMNFDARPSLPSDLDIDIDEYIEILLERFANEAIADKVERLCGDGVSKLCNFLMPVAKDSISSDRPLERIAIIYASYFHYLKRKVDHSDEPKYGLYEPQMDAASLKLFSQDPICMLQRLGMGNETPEFSKLVLESIQKIENVGVISALNNEVLVHA